MQTESIDQVILAHLNAIQQTSFYLQAHEERTSERCAIACGVLHSSLHFVLKDQTYLPVSVKPTLILTEFLVSTIKILGEHGHAETCSFAWIGFHAETELFNTLVVFAKIQLSVVFRQINRAKQPRLSCELHAIELKYSFTRSERIFYWRAEPKPQEIDRRCSDRLISLIFIVITFFQQLIHLNKVAKPSIYLDHIGNRT